VLTFAGLLPTRDIRITRFRELQRFSPARVLAFIRQGSAVTAQVARGFRLGGINDPLNVGTVLAK